jgi:hypothetical protein
MASKGLRTIACQGTRKTEVGYYVSHTTEIHIDYNCEQPA